MPEPAKPKKPVSERQLAANRANAQLSTGPRTPDGRNKSKYNNMIHGMRAATDVLPGESREDYELRLATVMREEDPPDEKGRILVERFVQASWKVERGERSERGLAI